MSSSSSSKVCYNSECANLKPERPRKGWRLHSGDCADLCDRCASTYEEGRFCETFHSNESGWRNCESCGKRIHCGCIISTHVYVLLDPGGVECLTCARKNIFVTPNPAWPPSLIFHIPLSERLKDPSMKNWNQLSGSGPVPWRQAPNLFSSSVPQPEMHPRVSYEVDISAGADRFNASERFHASSLEKKTIEEFPERYMNGNLNFGAPDIYYNNNKTGINHEGQRNSCLNISQQSSSLKEDPSAPQFGLTVPYISANETNGQIRVCGIHSRPTLPASLAKPLHGNLQSGVDSSGETQARNGRSRVDARARNQLLPRYWPRITDQELMQISGDSNSVITPLFEKMLSASDAGRIGRLVLPKKCAEAYFPPISQPEGLPLKVQDAKGKEWTFQFRFWPNNNSRMYVLEGVTPCIQSMQLQAGDIVTFSRLEPEGKLVMGFRKASATPSDQDNETKTGNGVYTHGDVELADPSSWSKVDKSGYIAKEALGAKSSIPRKRKNSALSLKSRRLRIENEDMIELKLTWEEAQGLLRPPPDHIPTVVVIEGFEFEEYEDAPVLGKPTILAADNMGEKVQWVQCEDCYKWRKLPVDALLPPRWICSDNSWDPERSLCSASQELTSEQLEDLLPSCNSAAKKMKAAKQDPDDVEFSKGLDALANLAILGEGEGEAILPSQATTKHPRHRPGCSCIVCIQPPSGKGPKHKQTCPCNVCLTVKRRFRTLMMRREKKQSEKEVETTPKSPQVALAENLLEDDTLLGNNSTGNCSLNQKEAVTEGSADDDPNKIKPTTSPFKGQIDLNIQPEREEEFSPPFDPGSTMKLIHNATKEYLEQQKSSNSVGNGGSAQECGHDDTGEIFTNGATPGCSADENQPATLSILKAPGSPSVIDC